MINLALTAIATAMTWLTSRTFIYVPPGVPALVIWPAGVEAFMPEMDDDAQVSIDSGFWRASAFMMLQNDPRYQALLREAYAQMMADDE